MTQNLPISDRTPKRYKMAITYDGTQYSGWQKQKNALSVQEEIEKYLSLILQKNINIIGSGRTDAQAHAHEQIAHFDIDLPLNVSRVCHSLNLLLPNDIKIFYIKEVSKYFHARYSVISKVYHYHIHTEPLLSPFLKDYRYHFPYPLSVELFQKAAMKFLGKHDFTSFANTGSVNHKPVKTMKRIDVIPEPGGIRLEFEADGFLYKMVRNITALLLQVATGKTPIEDIDRILRSKDRTAAAYAAPANALFLTKVYYPSELDKKVDDTKTVQESHKLLKKDKDLELLSSLSS